MNSKNRLKKCKKFGFTLTEILITLGIIGVVSALTIPTLMRDHQRRVYVTQLHKVYNELSEGAEAYIHERNSINLFEAGVRSQAGVDTFIRSRFKIAKNCNSTFTDCFASEYKNMNNGNVTNFNAAGANCYSLPSSASICVAYNNGLNRSGFIDVIVDVNGKSGPNIMGRDLFVMSMLRDGSLSDGIGIMIAACPRNPITGQVDQGCLDELNRTDLQKCQRASTMNVGSDASYCYVQVKNDGFVMNY